MLTPRRRSTREENSRQLREALVRAAVRVVAKHGFAGASVQRITQACGVSQGTLYTYFGSLQELLDELLPNEGLRMLHALGHAVDRSAGYFEQERQAFEALFAYLRRKPYFLRLLAEAEIAAPSSYRRHYENIEPRYLRALQHAGKRGEIRAHSDRELTVVGAVLSAARGYIAIGFCEQDSRRLFHPAPIPPWVVDTYLKFERSGVGSAQGVPARLSSREAVRSGSMRAAGREGHGTRRAILVAAARLIGTRGYVATSVADICAQAGIAVGTFYGHFPGRAEMFEALLSYVRMEMQADVAHATRRARSVLEYECAAFDAFFVHLHRDPWFPRIETEAAVWAPASYLRHFRTLSEDSVDAMRRLRKGPELALYADSELPMLSYIFMAARHDLAMRLVLAGGGVRRLPEWVRNAYMALVAHGLS